MSRNHNYTKIHGDCYHENTWSEPKPRNHFVPWKACLDCGYSVAPWVGKYGDAPGCRLTYEMALEICRDIRAGAYPWVAATKHVDYDTFRNWKSQRSMEFRIFHRMMDRAAAEARAEAEMLAKETDPKWWLKYGPGKKAPAEVPNDNWGEEQKVQISGQVNHAHGHVHLFKHEDLNRLSIEEVEQLETLFRKALPAARESTDTPDELSEAVIDPLRETSMANSGTSDTTD